MAKGGVSTKQAKKAYNTVKSHLEALDDLIIQLKTDVEFLNKEVWYGASRANKWYTDMSTRFDNLIKFDNGVSQFQDSLYHVFKKSTAKGIEF